MRHNGHLLLRWLPDEWFWPFARVYSVPRCVQICVVQRTRDSSCSTQVRLCKAVDTPTYTPSCRFRFRSHVLQCPVIMHVRIPAFYLTHLYIYWQMLSVSTEANIRPPCKFDAGYVYPLGSRWMHCTLPTCSCDSSLTIWDLDWLDIKRANARQNFIVRKICPSYLDHVSHLHALSQSTRIGYSTSQKRRTIKQPPWVWSKSWTHRKTMIPENRCVRMCLVPLISSVGVGL